MCFGSKPKGEDPLAPLNSDHNVRPVDNTTRPSSSKMPIEYAPPQGPPPSHQTPEVYRAPPGPPPNRDEYAPPPGPPPSHRIPEVYSAPPGPPPSHGEYAPPPGPPPSHRIPEVYSAPPGPPPNHDEYAPPSGPPPSHYQGEYAPPPGPPPAQEPYHDWQTAVPDTSLLPPPPSFFQGHQRSSTNNATEQEAEQGKAWCVQNPMTDPIVFPEAALEAIARGDIGVIKPRTYQGNLDRPRPGVWAGKTKASCPDSCITSTIPLYSVMAHSPLRTGRAKVIYYEVRIAKRNRPEVSLAMGFAAPPYPTFRLPGWHRGCLAVHGDDGSKYINDSWGGKDFTHPFKAGETLGLGMKFSARDINAPPSYTQTTATTPINVEIFLTRNGSIAGSWNLHEEGDAQEDLPVTGLEGFNDIYAAIGTFENVDFEIVFSEGEWMYRP